MSQPEIALPATTWYALDLEISNEALEATEYALMEAGALGTESSVGGDDKRVTGYFAQVPDRERVRQELQEAFRIYDLPSSSVTDMELREVANRDWLEEWKKTWQPVEIGRFLVVPPWIEVDSATDRLLIRIEPGMAFGTGTHETTRLCLAAIEKHYEGGSFLDVGTGTGILAIAAAKLFSESRIEACDIDPDAVAIAVDNATVNSVRDQIVFRVGSVDDSSASADLVCANLTADVIIPLLPTLIRLTCRRLILSGILDSQVKQVTANLLSLGMSNYEVTRDGEWACVIV